jgi:hypothetical protein
MPNPVSPITLFDRNHAAKIFIPNNFSLSPKYGWLFHVAFDLNPEIARLSNDEILKMGFVVKSASLPKFTVETKNLNAYNRIDIVQTKVKYDNTTIKFHDDNLDIIRKFWYDYYSYYYRDSDWNENIYRAASKYSERQNQIWGYTPRQYPASSSATQQFLTAIRIYSLHNKKFTEYTLINPIITQFQHGEHAQGGEAGTLENSMTVAYQAVKYHYGTVSEDTVSGFATLNYDSRPSSMGTTPVGDRTIHDMAEGLTGIGGILNNLKNLNGAALLGGALSAAGGALLTRGLSDGGITALAGGASSLLGKAKAGLGKVFSNGEKVDGALQGLGNGLPSDNDGASTDPQAQIDQVSAQLTADEEAIDQALADLEAGQAEQAQLEAQIESDTYTLEYDPNLSDEDIAALEQLITDNKAKLVDVIDSNASIQDNIDGLTTSVLDGRAKLDELLTVQNPSGNSADEGGPGPDSQTIHDPESGDTITTNPDGSQTIVSADGSMYTNPQQNPVNNANASSNQSNPYPDP